MTDQQNGNGHYPKKSEEIFDAPVNVSQDQSNITEMIRRAVVQCRALLRQDLERRARQQPQIYNQDHTNSILHQFEAASVDIEATIANRVRSKILSHIHHEIRRVLEDAVKDGAEPLEALEDPIWEEKGDRIPSPINKEDAPVNLGTGVEESNGVGGGALAVHPAQQPVDTPTPPTVQEMADLASQPLETEEHKAYPSSEATAVSKEPPHDSAEEVYEGTVKLAVQAMEGARQMVHFVEELRKKPDFQLLQLVGNYTEGVGIWLGLRRKGLAASTLTPSPGV